ncbi:PAS domain-containing protein [Psychrobacter pacificensis]|uniref:PAS domain-containing protein n=1 Tax=Psychrobacter pacificensis TaxID=112002 RepID=UPI003D026A89
MGSPIPDAHKPDLPADQITLTYHDGTSRTVYDTGVERPYPDGKLIVSRTDLDGIITHVNDAFVEISGYHVDELIGQQHYILRHPDMPKAAYKDLWDTAESGQKFMQRRQSLLGICHGRAQCSPRRNCRIHFSTP